MLDQFALGGIPKGGGNPRGIAEAEAEAELRGGREGRSSRVE